MLPPPSMPEHCAQALFGLKWIQSGCPLRMDNDCTHTWSLQNGLLDKDVFGALNLRHVQTAWLSTMPMHAVRKQCIDCPQVPRCTNKSALSGQYV